MRILMPCLLLFAALWVSQPSIADDAAESFVALDLRPATMSDADAETMARYNANPVNLVCDFVSFDSEPLFRLIAELDDGSASIGRSYVTVFLPNGAVLEYQGYAWEGVARHGRKGPFVWEGKFDGARQHFASIIIYSPTSATAYFSTQDGMYRLSRSTRQGHYFLCLRDPSFRRNSR